VKYAKYGVPVLICIAVHWLALRTWFSADDFAWLGLPIEVRDYHNWFDVLFGPRAQGTIRTLSERLYFLVLASVFGLNAVPFRIVAFLTAFANLALIVWIVDRLWMWRGHSCLQRPDSSGRSAAEAPKGLAEAWVGTGAATLWALSASLAMPLDWASSFNEVLCAFFLLSSFALLLKFFDTGQIKYWCWQWATFLLGFGALELIVTYPAIAALYTLLFNRRYFTRTLWLFIPSVLFTIYHWLYVPRLSDPHYKMHFDTGILEMLAKYWSFAAGAYRPEQIDWRPVWLGITLAVVALVAVCCLLWKRPRLTLFAIGWFVIVILPVLPLTAHFTEYYVAIPSIGLAMLGAFAIMEWPTVALPLAALYAIVSISDIYITDHYYWERARRIKRMTYGLAEDKESYAGKSVLLAGVDNDLFWAGFFDDPFRLIGIDHVYLAPGTEKGIDPHPEWGGIDRFVTKLEPALQQIREHKAVVYSVASDGSVRNVTSNYGTIASAQYLAEHREKVDVGDPLYASRLGEGWYNSEDGFRWMGKAAVVNLGGPSRPGMQLAITGFYPKAVSAQGPIDLTVWAGGLKLGSQKINQPDRPFQCSFALPDSQVGKYVMPVKLEVSRTTQAGSDVRQLGLIFGTFTIK
jgi:hypothetical protein